MTKLLSDTSEIEVTVCRTQDKLRQFIEAWDKLVSECEQRSPMLSYSWVSSFMEHRLIAGEQWYVLFAHRNSSLCGVLPLVVTPHSVAGLNRPILRTPNDNHTLGGDMVLARDSTDDVFRALFNAMVRETPLFFALRMARVADNSPSAPLGESFKRFMMISVDAGYGYYYPVTGSFGDFYQQLSKNMRGNLRRAENNLEKIKALNVVVKEGKDARADFLDKFMPVEASGWKGQEGSAIESNAELTAFYRTLTRRLEDSGMLRWECLYASGELIAANLSIRIGATVVIWKLGYDEAMRKYSPGSLLFKAVLERAFADDSISVFNLMSNTAWQTNWKPQCRHYYDLVFFPRRPLPMLLGYLPLQFKAAMKQVTALVRLVRLLRERVN